MGPYGRRWVGRCIGKHWHVCVCRMAGGGRGPCVGMSMFVCVGWQGMGGAVCRRGHVCVGWQ